MPHKSPFSKGSVKITLIYFVVSFLWIFFSDILLLRLTPEASQITHYQTIKGAVFVAFTSLIIFQLSRREIYKKDESLRATNKAKEEYYSLYKEYVKLNEKLKENNQELQEKNRQLKKYYERIRGSEERYRAFISQISEGVYRLDLPGDLDINIPPEEQIDYLYNQLLIGECNPLLAKMYGYQSVDELTGKKLKELRRKRENPDLYEFISQFVHNNYKIRNIEIREQIDQQEKYFNHNIIGIIQEQKLIRVWGTLQDITPMKEKEKEIIRQKEKAEESNRIKNAFLGNISHEIRTPLNSIMGFSELIGKNNLDDEQRKFYIDHIKDSGNQLLRIVSDILDISFIQTGQLTLYPKECKLNRFMKEVAWSVEMMIARENKSIRVQLEHAFDDNHDQILVDKKRLQQVMSNMAENAVKFTKEGEVKIGYQLNTENMLEFYVEDTGIGIAEEKRQLIFEHFRQADESMNRQYGGIGLGLSIVEGIVEAMGGNVTLASRPNEGSLFKFTLPLRKPHDEPDDETPPTESASASRKILIVEDQYDNYKLLEEFFRQSDVTILHAESGEEGMKLCAEHEDIDLVLMDLKLPGIDGIQTTKKIRKKKPKVPVIAQTAYIQEQLAGDKNLFNGYLTKPITKESFREVMSRHLNMPIL